MPIDWQRHGSTKFYLCDILRGEINNLKIMTAKSIADVLGSNLYDLFWQKVRVLNRTSG